MKFLYHVLQKLLYQKQQEVIRLQWEKAELEKKLKQAKLQ